jgi:hypothetical protein
MSDYDEYPEHAVEWWEEQEAPVYGKKFDDFEWEEVE